MFISIFFLHICVNPQTYQTLVPTKNRHLKVTSNLKCVYKILYKHVIEQVYFGGAAHSHETHINLNIIVYTYVKASIINN